MFTGIVEETGTVKKITKSAGGASLTVKGKRILKNIHQGDSVSVNGVCLTVTHCSKQHFSSDVSFETLKRTTLGFLNRGSLVNLEAAARLSDRIGGHLVSGHVDGIGIIKKIEPIENSFLFFIEFPKGLLRYCVEKGSVAVDGISLTINRVNQRGIFLTIIPYTLKKTTLGHKKVGDQVNIENDLIGKYIERFLCFK